MPIPYLGDLEAEERGWYEVSGLVRRLDARECLVPGYYRDPDWSVRDVVGHLGTWLAEAATQFERISAGTYEGHDVDIDGLKAVYDADPEATLVVPRDSLEVPVAATAWHHRLLCADGFDSKAITKFVEVYRDRGPEKGFVQSA